MLERLGTCSEAFATGSPRRGPGRGRAKPCPPTNVSRAADCVPVLRLAKHHTAASHSCRPLGSACFRAAIHQGGHLLFALYMRYHVPTRTENAGTQVSDDFANRQA